MIIEKSEALGSYLKKGFTAAGLLAQKISAAGYFDAGYGILFTDEKRIVKDYFAGQKIDKEGSLKSLDDFVQREFQNLQGSVFVFEDPTFRVQDMEIWKTQNNLFFVEGHKMHYFDHATKDSFSGIALDSESDTMLYGICSTPSRISDLSNANEGAKAHKDISVIDDLVKRALFIITSIFDGECYVIWVPRLSPFLFKFL